MSASADLPGIAQTLGQVLLAPRSIALYGASDDAAKVGARPLTFLTEAAWSGRIYPVNPRRETVLGHRAWSSLAELPEFPDQVVPYAPHVVLELGDPPGDLPFPGPVVVKALSAQLPHKSDAGGVVTGVRDATELAEAMSRISRSVEAANRLPVTRVLVQPMVDALGEVLVGYRHDPASGPIVVLAAGGVTAELHADRSLRPAPIDRNTALEMIGEVVALKVLADYRGALAGDLVALADAVVALSRIGDASGTAELPDILEGEVNPLMILPAGQGVLAVDGLVVASSPA